MTHPDFEIVRRLDASATKSWPKLRPGLIYVEGRWCGDPDHTFSASVEASEFDAVPASAAPPATRRTPASAPAKSPQVLARERLYRAALDCGVRLDVADRVAAQMGPEAAERHILTREAQMKLASDYWRRHRAEERGSRRTEG